MILQTPILALLLASVLASGVALWSGGFAMRVLRQWELDSGSRAQIRLERATQLVSTLFGAVLLAQIAALLLFVFNADRMAALFVGAMCAVGTLNVNAWGFPALGLKIAVFFAAALWLIVDRLDRSAPDYPLTRVKYGALLAMVPLLVASVVVEIAYFTGLKTDVITSCCSKLFTPVNDGLAAEMTGLPPGMALALLAGAGGAVALTGAAALRWPRLAPVYAVAGGALFGAALTAIVSAIALYIYDHPNHHCPFCILQPEYSYVGYALYVPLFAGTAMALGAGVAAPFARVQSLSQRAPALSRRLIRLSLGAFALFGAVVLAVIWRSNLILLG